MLPVVDQSPPYLPLVQAVEEVTGRRVHLCTVLRWCTRGTRGRKLKSALVGGRRMTRSDWVLQFIANEPSTGSYEPEPTPRQIERASIRSAKRLSKRLGRAH